MSEDLDATALRATEARLKRTGKAARQEFFRDAREGVGKAWRGLWAFLATIWDAALGNLVFALVLAGALAAGAYDWWVSSRGWLDMYPGLGVFAFAGAAAAIAMWYAGAHLTWEAAERKDLKAGVLSGVMAAVGYVICVAGVFIGVATDTQEARDAARQSRQVFLQLQVDRDALQDKLATYSPEYWQLAVAADRRALTALENIAKGTYQMPDLEIDEDGGCGPAYKLNFNQRRLCAQANGGVDENTGKQLQGARSRIEQSERGLEASRADQIELDRLNGEIATFDAVEADNTAAALQTFIGGTSAASGDRAQAILQAVLQAVFLLGGGALTIWAMNMIQARQAKAQATAKARREAADAKPAKGAT